jgi:hypothetical protein
VQHFRFLFVHTLLQLPLIHVATPHMAEVLGPLGISLGGLSFIFGTASNAGKFFNTFKDRKQQNLDYRKRVHVCRDRYVLWEKYWQLAKVEEDEDYIVSNLDDLAYTIDESIKKYLGNKMEKEAWEEMKDSSRKGIFRLPRTYVGQFCDNLRYALWRKDVIDGWVVRLENATKATESLFQDYFHAQTAGHFHGAASLEQSKELAKLQSLFGNLESMATSLYHECIGIPTSHTAPSGCYEWALGLRPPETPHSVLNWDLPTPINIELHASVKQESKKDENLHLCIRYQSDNKETHKTNGRIAHLLRRNASKTHSSHLDPPIKYAECHDQHTSARRTLTIGELLTREPHLFEDAAWKVERAELVHGVSDWNLLLWNTPWFEQLCCHKIAIEVNTCASNCARQILEIEQAHSHQSYDHSSRLRNLGLVLAQLILAVPLRPAIGDDLAEFEQQVNGEWETVHLTALNAQMYAATSDLQVAKAIYFCLNPEPDLPSDDFKLGYLFMCIDRIYNPFVSQPHLHFTRPDIFAASWSGVRQNRENGRPGVKRVQRGSTIRRRHGQR